MFVLLNLREQSSLDHVMRLLISAGYKTAVVGDRIEDLCPSCDASPNTARPTIQARSDCETQATIDSIASRFAILHNIHEHENEQKCAPLLDNDTPNDNFLLPSSSSCQQPHLMYNAPQEHEELEEDGSLEGDDYIDVGDAHLPGMTMRRMDDRIVHARSRKRYSDGHLMVINSGDTTTSFKCEVCTKNIARNGQAANLVNHLNRHSRLHATKKQFSCGACGAFFTRKYLTTNHISDRHPLEPHTAVIDHGQEMREEYSNLMEKCFPGALTMISNMSQRVHEELAEY